MGPWVKMDRAMVQAAAVTAETQRGRDTQEDPAKLRGNIRNPQLSKAGIS